VSEDFAHLESGHAEQGGETHVSHMAILQSRVTHDSQCTQSKGERWCELVADGHSAIKTRQERCVRHTTCVSQMEI
jgi:hypothetical protein